MSNPISIQQIQSVLATQRKEATRFSLPFSYTEINTLLVDAYQNEVAARSMTFRCDEKTSAKIEKVAKWLTTSNLKPCLMLYGGVGNGKSTIARAVKQVFIAIKETYTKTKDDWRCTDEQQRFIDKIRDTLPEPIFISSTEIVSAASSNKEEYERIKCCRFLIIDDMGIEPSVVKNFGTEITPLTDIIYHRYDRAAMTIITSNLDDQSIKERYGERVSDRLTEIFERLKYDNESYR